VGLRHLASVAALIIVGLFLAGCVAPQYTYVTDSADSAYFKVPPSWRPVNESTLQAAEGSASQNGTYLWTRAFDDTAKPSVNNVFSATAAPVAYSGVLGLSASQRNGVSFNSMRDLLLPVTSSARQAASAAHEQLSGFASLSDQVITDSHNDRGIREIFDYDLGATLETFDLTVLTNSPTTKLYFLLVHCTATCFANDYHQIASVVGSFTVGGGS
jgi:hypothetical protein